MSQTFDLNKCERNADGQPICATACGLPAVVADTQFRDSIYESTLPILAIIDLGRYKKLVVFRRDGTQPSNTYRLINPPRKFRIERWVRVFRYDNLNPSPYYTCSYHNTEADAREHNGKHVALVKVIIEGTEGEGL